VLVSSRTTNVLLILVLAVGIGIVAMLATGGRAGPLDPPGTPGSTLPQVEPRSPIPPVGWNGAFPITITQPGSYLLTRDLQTPGGVNGINVSTGSVEIDLNGFTLSGNTSTGTGISSSSNGVRVVNGRIGDFANGVVLTGLRSFVGNVRVVFYGTGTGIAVGDLSSIDGCEVGFGGAGVSAGTFSVVENCIITDVPGDGLVILNSGVAKNNVVSRSATLANKYGIRTIGSNAVVRGNELDNGTRDIGVGGHGAMIIDNIIHCYTSIVNLGGFSYWAPVDGQMHSNEEQYAAGFC
jgi:hypothetical protein